jgi:hypothetical protein
MPSRALSFALVFGLVAAAVSLDACSGSSDTSAQNAGFDASAADDGGATSDGGGDAGANDGSASDSASGPPQSVTFTYTPQWQGVKSVSVIGGFGQANDWSATQPFVALASDGHGGFTGTAMLAPGSYLYVLKVTGDAASATPDTFVRYAFDPTSAAFEPCPAQSPTFDKNAPNPCSKVAVPQSATPAAAFHVKGVVKQDGQPIAGYLVEIERNENGSHHFFANRTTTAADGSFDLVATNGTWRMQILHPTYLAKTDAERDPIALAALRRAISSDITLSADVMVNGPDVAYHDYASYSPRGDAGALPTVFAFATGPTTRLTVYGTGANGASNEIGDPWYNAAAMDGGAAFDGGFNTKQAMDPAVKSGERYFWGTESATAKIDGGVQWTGQTMVFAVTWQ